MRVFLSINNHSAAKAVPELGWQPEVKISLLADIEKGSYCNLI